MVGSHGGKTSMGAWILSLFSEECEEDEEDGRSGEFGGREREERNGFCVKLMRGERMRIFIVLRRLGLKWGK